MSFDEPNILTPRPGNTAMAVADASAGTARSAVTITPDDDNDLESPTRGIYLGTGGDLKVDMLDDGSQIIFKNMIAGVVYPLRVKRIYETGTTISDILGVY